MTWNKWRSDKLIYIWNEVCLECSDIWAAAEIVLYKTNKKEIVSFYYFNTLEKNSSKENKAFCRTVDSYGYKKIIQNKTIITKF